MTERPRYPQHHPAMAVARNIVNQILDAAGTTVDARQRINDDCDQFVAGMLDSYAERQEAEASSRIVLLRRITRDGAS